MKKATPAISFGVIVANLFGGNRLVNLMDAAEVSIETTTRGPDDDAANQIAREIFLKDEYWWKRTSEVKSGSFGSDLLNYLYEHLIQPVLKAFFDLLRWILDWLSGGIKLSSGDWSSGVPFLWTIISLLTLYVVYYVASRVMSSFRGRSNPSHAQTDLSQIDVLPRADSLLEQARATLSQGDRRSAIRLAFLSLLAWFQDQGQLKYDPSRSNREYQRDLQQWPDSVSRFRAAAAPFEQCWYGGRDLDIQQVENVIALCREWIQTKRIPTTKGKG